MTIGELLSQIYGPLGALFILAGVIWGKLNNKWYTAGEYNELKAAKEQSDKERDQLFLRTLDAQGVTTDILETIKLRYSRGELGRSPIV